MGALKLFRRNVSWPEGPSGMDPFDSICFLLFGTPNNSTITYLIVTITIRNRLLRLLFCSNG